MQEVDKMVDILTTLIVDKTHWSETYIEVFWKTYDVNKDWLKERGLNPQQINIVLRRVEIAVGNICFDEPPIF